MWFTNVRMLANLSVLGWVLKTIFSSFERLDVSTNKFWALFTSQHFKVIKGPEGLSDLQEKNTSSPHPNEAQTIHLFQRMELLMGIQKYYFPMIICIDRHHDSISTI